MERAGVGAPATAPPRAASSPDARRRRLAARTLPRGVDLPERAWFGRHRAVSLFLVVLASAVVVWAAVLVRTPEAVLEAVVLAVLAAAALAVPHRHRRLAATAASLGLLLATAFLVHLSGGLIEMHFLFFVIVAAVTLYQQWAPFLAAVGFVVLHHGVVGTLAPELTYNHPDAVANPWAWAGVHGGFVALASVVGLAAWRFDELVREELRHAGEHHRVVLDSVGDAVVAVDDAGRVTSLNTTASAVLAGVAVGVDLHTVLHPGADHPAHGCALVTLRPGGRSRTGVGTVTTRRGEVPVRYRLTAVTRTPGAEDPGTPPPARAVLAFTDLSGEERARAAESRLRDLSEELRAEREEVEQLIASVGPRALVAPGVTVAAAYRPAPGALVGGDLYDWFATADGVVHVSVVDAMGKGVGATHQAIAVLHAIRVLVLDGTPLDALLARADRVLMRHDPDLCASAVVARLDPGTGAVQVASAGHPRALLRRADGSTGYLSSEGIGLGVPGAGSLRVAHDVLGPGDVLALYTDGLVEGTRDLDRGFADLERTARAAGAEPPDRLARTLVDDSPSASDDDDRVAVVVRYSGPPGQPSA